MPDRRLRLCAGASRSHGESTISRRIAFINEKGGSAKTTLVANLGAYLALKRGRRVTGRSAIDLLLDTMLDDAALDVPGPRPAAAGGSPTSGLPVVPTRIPNLDLVVANKALALFPAWDGGDGRDGDPTDRLEKTLGSFEALDDYDFVLFDAPPSFGPLTLNVLRAATELVVPVPLTFLALDGCAELVRSVSMVRSRYGHDRLAITMVVPTFYRRTRMANEVLDSLKQRFPKELAHTVVGFHVKLDEAQSHGLSIFEYAASSRAARAMAALAEELELRGGGNHEAAQP
ncbi:MAG: ParA family protein [Deltaproteobacteria bacterium]|nr:ParA family protein [Deltaproteobacteria bacterium]